MKFYIKIKTDDCLGSLLYEMGTEKMKKYEKF